MVKDTNTYVKITYPHHSDWFQLVICSVSTHHLILLFLCLLSNCLKIATHIRHEWFRKQDTIFKVWWLCSYKSRWAFWVLSLTLILPPMLLLLLLRICCLLNQRKQTINRFHLCAENSLQTVKVEFTECGVEHERLTQCPCTCFINTTTCWTYKERSHTTEKHIIWRWILCAHSQDWGKWELSLSSVLHSTQSHSSRLSLNLINKKKSGEEPKCLCCGWVEISQLIFIDLQGTMFITTTISSMVQFFIRYSNNHTRKAIQSV